MKSSPFQHPNTAASVQLESLRALVADAHTLLSEPNVDAIRLQHAASLVNTANYSAIRLLQLVEVRAEQPARVKALHPLTIFFSTLICASAKAREDSYDSKAADESAAELAQGTVSSASFYRLTNAEACQKVCLSYGVPELSRPVELLLREFWNDALAWAESPQPS